ncbi:Cyclin-dependent kinase 10 [Borealophlyctis nickersoniae]|nr:Cyclin-dependent kinase 10 [Borealophlyctis nickersoniae]
MPSAPIVTISQSFLGASRPVDTFEKLNRIGEGTYGIVYRARDRRSGDIVALKRIRMEHEQEGLPISSLREISLLKSLNHENIVRVLDVVVGNGLGYFCVTLTGKYFDEVMEYCEQDMGNLMDTVISKGPGYKDAEGEKVFAALRFCCIKFTKMLFSEYLHDNYIIHRDLKLSNLLLTSRGALKIADFGLARKFGKPNRPMTPRVVTLWYRAPELLFGEKNYTTAIDMWAVGCIFGELLKCTPLMPGKVERQQIEMICNLLGTPNDDIWPGFSSLPYARSVRLPDVRYDDVESRFKGHRSSTKKLLKGLLTYCPSLRLDIKRALRHDYFRDGPPACNPMMLPSFPEGRNEVSDGARARYQMRQEAERRGKGEDDRRRADNHNGRGKGGVGVSAAVAKRAREVGDMEMELGVPAFKQFRMS